MPHLTTSAQEGLRIGVTCSKCHYIYEAENWVLHLALETRKNKELHRILRYICEKCNQPAGHAIVETAEWV